MGSRVLQQLLDARHHADASAVLLRAPCCPRCCCAPLAACEPRLPPPSLPTSYACYLGFQLYTHVDLFADEPNNGPTSNGLPGEESEEANEPMMSLFTAVTMLTIITLVVAAASE